MFSGTDAGHAEKSDVQSRKRGSEQDLAGDGTRRSALECEGVWERRRRHVGGEQGSPFKLDGRYGRIHSDGGRSSRKAGRGKGLMRAIDGDPSGEWVRW